jgi:filamentous hemagglutinin family protein
MNKNLFRLVFNAARGQVVAVSEIASSHSGGKSASAGGSKLSRPLASAGVTHLAIKSTMAAIAMLAAPAWLSTVWAQALPATTIVVNGAAPASQQPTVTNTASGITQVNIQAAVGGVSRNRYTQFDVGSPGLILNNSPVNSNTQLGGWVAGNTNLATGSANIILNEVNSTNPSQLRGYIEVAGQKAEVVIANPAGISVNGGGFINASGATLTTGTPQFSGNSLNGYQVNSGTITVTGNGLDTATTGITKLQAQKIILQGGVFAQDLRVTADNSAGANNAVAIDVSAIGGMYANKITILATGLGAGVNNAGKLQANSGSFTLSADGTLTNTGTLNSTGTTRINAQTVNNSTGGAIYGGSVAIAATTLNNAAANSTDTAPVIAARDSGGRVDIGVQTLNNQEGALIYSAGALAIGGSLDANGQATGRASTVTNNSATLEAAGNVAITAQTLANTYASLGYRVEVDPTTPATTGSADCGVDCTHTWVDTYYRAVAVAGPNGAAVIRSGADIALDTTTSATNSSSQVLAAGTLSTAGVALNNQGIDLTSQVATRRDHTVVVTYMQNGLGCDSFGFGCHSERRWRTTTSTDYIARNQTIGPALAQSRTATPSSTTLPNSALFAVSSNASYLVETNPAFTNRQIWLSSDYMLSALAVDPDITQKRMGDGFYEQRLINEQVAQLTGYRRLANYSSDEQQYQALMTSGITQAKSLQLRVGIALTAEQAAQLTSDIVWLVQQEVTLKDGSKQKVLVPQVYAVARSGDLASNGALLSGNNVNFNTAGDFSNANGTIQGRELVSLTATNVRNLAGRIEGKTVALNAAQDIENIGGAVIAQQGLTATAGRDIKVQTTTMESTNGNSAANGSAPTQTAGGMLGGASGGTSSGLQTRSTDISRVAGLYVTGDTGVLLASAGRDVQLEAALLQSAGNTQVNATRNLNLSTVATSASMDATKDSDNYNRTSRSTEVGVTLQSAGNTTLTAGQDFKARAADVQATGNLAVTAGNNVVIESGTATNAMSSASKTSNSGFMSSSSRTERSSSSSTQAIASNFGGGNVSVTSGQDIGVKASNVVADKDLSLSAGKNVTVEAGTNTQTQSSFSALSESGLMSGGDLGVSVGNRDQSTDQKNTRTTAAASTIGSTGGNVRIAAGQTFTQSGSDVLATNATAGNGNIDITAKKVDIVEARETSATETKSEFKQSGLTVSLSNPVVSAAQTMQKMASAAENTKSDRMKALAAASAALASRGAVKEVGNLINGQTSAAKDLELNISLGSSSSESKSTSTSDTARGSSLTAGGNTTIRATGDGANSNLTVRGSTIQSGDTTTLAADNQVLLLAAANTSTQTSDQKSSSGSLGVTLGKDKFGVSVSASQGSGDGNGQDANFTNTRIESGKVVNIQSGGDTALKGAVVKANTVNANVGGNLQIESLSDSSRYKESSQNSSGSLTVGYGAGGSVSVGATKINSNYQSVTEQSALRAGDGGFNVNVQGNTDLRAGAITSTQKAIDDNKNSFQTAKLTTSDASNSASFQAESYQVTAGTSGGSAGAGQDSGSANSTTRAAVSGIAGNKNARTGDAETGIQKIFDQTAVTKDINAQVAITQEFGKQAPKAVAEYAQSKFKELEKTNPEEAKKWAEGGIYRVALHTTLGALTGGASGAAGAATIASAAPLMDQLQGQLAATLEKAGLSQDVAAGISKTIAQTTALAVGTAVGGVQGGTMALNVDANNRQLHPNERKLAAQLAAKSKGKYTAKQIEDAMRNSGNGNGETVVTGMLVNANDPGAIYDKGAQWQKGEDGKLIQVLPNSGKVDPALAAFITNNTGGNNSAYSWYDSQLGKTSPTQVSTGTGGARQRYEQYAANGKVYTLPIADCPAVSCTNDTPIARFGVTAEDAATIAAYDAAKKKEMAKDAVAGGLIVGTALTFPATAPGAIFSGAIVGGGSSAANQAIDGKSIDGAQVGVDAAKGAAIAVAGYGVVKGVGIADDVLSKAATRTDDAAALEAQAIAKQKLENNARADDDALSTSLRREEFRNGTHVVRNPEALTGLLREGAVELKPGVTANEVFENVLQKPIGQRLEPEKYLSPTYIANELARYDDGAARIVLKSSFEKYGLGQKDGTSFVMPKSEADQLIKAAGSDPIKLADALGLPRTALDGDSLIRIDIPNPRLAGLRLPSGNEAGANSNWIPGGKLPGGASEAVIDASKVPNLIQTPIAPSK